MGVTMQRQTAIDEQLVEDTELEALLEQREAARVVAAAHRKSYSDLDEQAKVRIRALELGDDVPARCGRFVFRERPVVGRSVAFDTEPTRRISIRAVPVDAEGF